MNSKTLKSSFYYSLISVLIITISNFALIYIKKTESDPLTLSFFNLSFYVMVGISSLSNLLALSLWLIGFLKIIFRKDLFSYLLILAGVTTLGASLLIFFVVTHIIGLEQIKEAIRIINSKA